MFVLNVVCVVFNEDIGLFVSCCIVVVNNVKVFFNWEHGNGFVNINVYKLI